MAPSLLATLLFSVSVICGHRSARLIGGTEANFWRLTLATVFLGVWSYTCGRGLEGVGFPLFFISGIVGIGIGDVALFQALPRLGPRLSLLLIQCLTAPIGAAVEWLWLGTALTRWQILCVVMILSGVGLALKPEHEAPHTPRELNGGIIACVIAACGGAIGAVLSRKAYALANSLNETLDGGNAAFQRIVGGLLVAAVCLLVVKRKALRIQARAPQGLVVAASKRKWAGAWPWILVNSLAGQTLGVSCMQWALETTATAIVLAIIALTPIAVIPLAIMVEGERPTRHSLAGAAIAVAGVIALALSR